LFEWRNAENEEIYHISEYKSITEVENICKELLHYHYLGLWLEWWFFDGIELNKKIHTSKTIYNPDTNTNKKISLKRTVIISYK
jgi:hypothetical protein